MGRKALKKSKGYKSPGPAPQAPDASSAESSNFPLCDDIDDNFARIYESFFLEFRKRVADRKTAKDPLDSGRMQRSTLDTSFRARLITKVQTLSRAIGLKCVIELIEGRTLDFIERLLIEVKAQEADPERLATLEDSFDVLDNAVDVVESLAQNSRGSPMSVLRRAKIEFYRMVEEDEELHTVMDWGERMEGERPHEMYEERRYLTEEYTEEEETAYLEQLKSQALLENMSLEELVLYINEESSSSRRNTSRRESSQSTADCSTSPRTEEDREADREVEEFRKRLEVARKKHATLMKPRLSDEWLKRLSLSLHTALQSAA